MSHRKMARRVAERHLNKEAFVGKIFDFFKTPEREVEKKQQGRTDSDMSSVTCWFRGSPYNGIQPGNLQYKLGIPEGKNSAFIEHKGETYKLIIGSEVIKVSEDLYTNMFTTLTLEGLKTHKRMLEVVVNDLLKKGRVNSRRYKASFTRPR